MYPHLPLRTAMSVAEERVRRMHLSKTAVLDDLATDIGDGIGWTGSGTRIDVAPLEYARMQIEALAASNRNLDGTSSTSDQDLVEGEAAAFVHSAIVGTGLNPASLDDPGFWRYVSLAHAWNFAAWREPRAFAPVTDDNGTVTASRKLGVYVDGRKPDECVPLRMFLRVRCLGGTPYAHLAKGVRRGTDFWRSHILRVVAGEHPSIVRAMVRRQADDATRLNRDPLREFAKQLNRTLVNLAPAMLDDAAADALVGELWVRQST